MRQTPDPGCWGLARQEGRLAFDGCDLPALAAAHGTPLHVVSARMLRARVRAFRDAFAAYPGPVRICFSYKTNRLLGVLRILHAAGCGAEVVNGLELELARALGVAPADIVLNGPCKTDAELALAVSGAGLVVADGLEEIARLAREAAAAATPVPVALRVCPGVRPRGMNPSSATGARRAQFGFDLRPGELDEAIRATLAEPALALRGVMAHVGSGIRDLRAVARTVDRLLDALQRVAAAGGRADVLDVGGGLGARLARELTTFELLRYLATGRPPGRGRPAPPDLVQRYGAVVVETVVAGCARRGLPIPTLVLEPGRVLVSDAQLLLLRVGAVRERRGVGRFALTDGGAMTVSMMFLSEQHAMLLANRDAASDGRTSVFGRLPSPMDVVYRSAHLPRLAVGDLLAVMDAGAYFTATETTFGGARPAVVLIDETPRLIRRRETLADRIALEAGGDAIVPA
jgi:diaminopimelate decarboxylase